MSIGQKAFLASCLAVVASSAVWVFRNHAATIRAELALHEVEQNRTAAVADLDKAKRALAAVEQQLRAAQQAQASLQKKSAKETAARSDNPVRTLDTDPVLQNARIKAQRYALSAVYRPFYRKHGLSSEVIEKFEENIAKREELDDDLQATGRLQGLSQLDPALVKLQQENRVAYENEQRQLLGDEAYRDLQQYERTSEARDYVSGLVGNALLRGVSFSPEQSEQLVSALVASSLDYSRGKRVVTSKLDWEASERRAAQFLTPEQLAAFQELESRGRRTSSSRLMIKLNAVISQAISDEQPANPSRNSGG